MSPAAGWIGSEAVVFPPLSVLLLKTILFRRKSIGTTAPVCAILHSTILSGSQFWLTQSRQERKEFLFYLGVFAPLREICDLLIL